MAGKRNHSWFPEEPPSSCRERHDRVRVWLYIQTLTHKKMQHVQHLENVRVVVHPWPVTAIVDKVCMKYDIDKTNFKWDTVILIDVGGRCLFLVCLLLVVCLLLIDAWSCHADVGKPLRFLSLFWMLHCKVLQTKLQTSSVPSLAGSLPFLWLNV